ncbi:uncharacterized protein LOC103460428 isoform X1 [Poecilia reticulata]|uniref:Uncharacterized LOC103460428 n=1 Tax=Poecilia reticulata TaxID=8081 RepID=A0A3P9PSN0_POERE|nr:PREDICTED: uncharacterized protein LOC103460428 isoform X1 [Poecilia reticulata]XP_008400806.1 PREDICTED: uncharacterized protein LOC103460428 isoform X1 [Poecilia reticulata]
MLSRPLTETRGRDPTAEALPTDLPLADADEALAGGFVSLLICASTGKGVDSSYSPAGGPAPPAPPCCSCASLLPRLLAAHRMEVRRLLRGALSSLGRRLDSLERKRRKKRKEGGRGGPPSVTCSSSSSSASSPHVVTSSSTSSDLMKWKCNPSCSFSLSEKSRRGSEGEEVRRRKRRRSHEGFLPPGNEEEEEERFVGQMAVSVRGRGGPEEEEAEHLVLHDFNQRKRRRRVGQSEQGFSELLKKNGYSSQHALLPVQAAVIGQTCGQSQGLAVLPGQWTFSDIITHLSSNRTHLQPWLQNPAPVLHLSAVAMETVLDWVKGGACWNPLRPLRDWTAPPSLDSDHSYIRRPMTSSTGSPQGHHRLRSNHGTWSLWLPRQRALALNLCSANGLSAALPADQSAALSEFHSTNAKLSKRVSQIRIRRALPRETPLTPMGLPKAKRLKKKEFSLEEIYTNKNYEAPPNIRSLETIFEEPREKDGALLLIGQQKRRRLLLFPDFTQPRKRKKPQGVGLPVSLAPRKRGAVRRHVQGGGLDDGSDVDVMLVERLSELDDFLTQQGLDV